MARDEIPSRVVIAEIVCSAVLIGLSFDFLVNLPRQFGSGFQVIPMVLAEVVGFLSLGLIAYVCLFVLFPQWTHETAPRVLWVYIFAGIWLRVLTFCSVCVLLSGGLSWYLHRETGGFLRGPLIGGAFSLVLALAGWGRVRRIRKEAFFKENDERIRQQGEWFKTRFVNGILVQRRRMGLADMPSLILLLLVFFLIGMGCLVLGIAALGRGDLFALLPLLFGGVFTVFPFYWLALLVSQLRNKPLTLVALLEKDLAALLQKKPDVLTGQRTVLLLLGLFTLVPLAVSSMLAMWGGFLFAVVAGGAGFVSLNMTHEKLARRQKSHPMESKEFEHVRQRLARRGCDYGLILLVGGLLMVTLAPGIAAWGTGEEPVVEVWGKFAFPAWAWLMLAALSSWYERVVKPVWPDDVDPTAGLRIAEIITWPFQLFVFLNPWEVLMLVRKRLSVHGSRSTSRGDAPTEKL